MDARERLAALARVESATAPVVSVYLDTRWGDEQQRERVRVFLKNAVARARAGDEMAVPAAEDTTWIQEEGERVVSQARFADAGGVAMFACAPLGLREVLPSRAPFAPRFVVGERPFLTPLAALVDQAPPSLVVFVDGQSARLLPFDLHGTGEEVTLEHEVPGRHARGGWAQLAQSRYQRHVEVHRHQHFEAVAQALDAVALDRGVERLVLAGDPRAVAGLQTHLPPRLAALVAGGVPGTRHEPGAALLERAAKLLESGDRARVVAAVEAVIAEAAKGGRGAAGAGDVLTAVARGAVHCLYLLRGLDRSAGACAGCGALQETAASACRACGGALRPVDLGDSLVARVLAARGSVEVVEASAGLERVGGVAARLRFPL